MQLSSASLPLSLIIQQYHHRLTTDHTRTVVNSYALLFIDIHSKLSFSRIGRGAVLSVDHNVILCYDVCGWTRKKHRFKNNTVLVRACVKQNIIALWAKYEENSSETTRNLAPVWDSRRRPAALESPWTTRKFVCSPSYLMVSTVRFSYVENDFLTRWPGGGGCLSACRVDFKCQQQQRNKKQSGIFERYRRVRRWMSNRPKCPLEFISPLADRKVK